MMQTEYRDKLTETANTDDIRTMRRKSFISASDRSTTIGLNDLFRKIYSRVVSDCKTIRKTFFPVVLSTKRIYHQLVKF